MLRPFVSVVTPFHNTVDYLAQCIESVLNQTYDEFEYILVDNCSTDGSSEIAEEFACRDSRIRLFRRTELLSQVKNYNRALQEMCPASQYCKIVQADDLIFPECLQLMVDAFAESESIGLVSSYWLKGNEVRGSGFPFPDRVMFGGDLARHYLREGLWVFGSPTTVMYRSSLVRDGKPFYDELSLHEDTEKCFQILQNWNFGFVHEVLSFSRAENESISSTARPYDPVALDRYILIQRYADAFLETAEARVLKRDSKRLYYRSLAHQALKFRDARYWRYHIDGLKTLGETLDRPYLAYQIGQEALWMAANPGATIGRANRVMRRWSARSEVLSH